MSHLINLHLSEGIVDLGGGELDTEGHEGVPEGVGINLAVHLEGLEGGKDDVIIVGSTGHLGGEEGDHLGEVHWSVDLVKHSLGEVMLEHGFKELKSKAPILRLFVLNPDHSLNGC